MCHRLRGSQDCFLISLSTTTPCRGYHCVVPWVTTVQGNRAPRPIVQCRCAEPRRLLGRFCRSSHIHSSAPIATRSNALHGPPRCTSTRPTGNRWLEPTATLSNGPQMLHHGTFARPTGNRWHAPTATHSDTHPERRRGRSAHPMGIRWHAPTATHSDARHGPRHCRRTSPTDTRVYGPT